MDSLLTRKEVCALRRIVPSTLWRWEREGLTFVRGRISEMQLAWWLEQADAAKKLGMKVPAFLSLPREEREKLLLKAFASRRAR